jgi:hypothetical protein
MNMDHFEKQIKDLFDKHKPESDTEQIWQNIEPHLKKKKKRRGILFLFFGAGLLFFFGLFLWKNRPLPHPADASSAQPKSSTTESMSAEQQQIVANKPAAHTSTVPQFLTKNKDFQTARSETNASKAERTADEPRREQTSPGVSKTPGDAPADIAPVLTNPARLEAPVTENPVTEPFVPFFMPKSNMPSDILEADTASAALRIVAKTPKADRTADKSSETKRPKSKKPKRDKGPVVQRFAVQAGPALPIKTLKKNPRSAAPDKQLYERKNSEKMLEAYAANVFYGIGKQNGFFFKGGLVFRQFNEKFHFGYIKKETQQITGVVAVTVDATGATVDQTTGTKTLIKTTEYSNTAYNRYHFLNLPAGIGYRQTRRNNCLEFAAGVDYNLFFRFKGTIFAYEAQPLALSRSASTYRSVFRNRLDWGMWAAAGYSRRLSPTLRWSVSAQLQMPFSPLTQPDYALEQRYYSMGIQGGLTFDLTR